MKYEYGKEYECNGVKPEGLADDVLVEIKVAGYPEWGSPIAMRDTVLWGETSSGFCPQKFRIVDERYKPAPERGWYDYDKLVTVGLPPAGKIVEFRKNPDEWLGGVIFGHRSDSRGNVSAYINLNGGRNWDYSSQPDRFRPLDWDRESKRGRDKTVSDAISSAKDNNPDLAVTDNLARALWHLYDIGMLRPQEQKK